MRISVSGWTGNAAIVGDTLAHRGPHTIFTVGKSYQIDEINYRVLSVTSSQYVPGVTLVKLQEI